MSDQLSSKQVEVLLDRLSGDDDYRKLFVNDLGAALKQLPGSPAVPEGVVAGGCLMPVRLADKKTIEGSRQRLFEELTAMQPHIPKILEA